MRAIGLDYSALITRGDVCSLANIFFIFGALASSWFIHDVEDINCKSPSMELWCHTFMYVKAMLYK